MLRDKLYVFRYRGYPRIIGNAVKYRSSPRYCNGINAHTPPKGKARGEKSFRSQETGLNLRFCNTLATAPLLFLYCAPGCGLLQKGIFALFPRLIQTWRGFFMRGSMKGKKLLLTVTAIIVAVSILFSFAACNNTPEVEKGAKTATLIVIDADGKETVVSDDTDTEFVDKWLIEMNDEKKITLTYDTSEYGMNISTLNGIAVGSSSSSYFAFYSDDADNTAASEFMPNFVRGDKTYLPTLYGQSTMPVKNGMTYILKYAKY